MNAVLAVLGIAAAVVGSALLVALVCMVVISGRESDAEERARARERAGEWLKRS